MAPSSVPAHPPRPVGDPQRDRTGHQDGNEDGNDVEDATAARYRWPDAVHRRPVVRAVIIGSLDGAAALDGRSAGLGGPADVRRFALLRDLADVVLVGAGTVRAEGYGGVRLDAHRADRRRRWGLAGPPPVAVITAHGLDPDLPIFQDTETRPIVFTTAAAPPFPAALADVVVVGENSVDPAALLAELGRRGLRRVQCEGGPALLGDLVAAGLVDELCLTLSPTLVGTDGARTLPRSLPAAVRWSLLHVDVEDDLVFLRYGRARG